MDEPEHAFRVLRGSRIEEMKTEDLLALADQIEADLPQDIGELTMADHPKLLELELIEDELERRHHSS